jgi:hypothetical protein
MGQFGGNDMRGFGILAIALALAGCAANNQPGRFELFSSKDETDAKDDAICRQYGAKPGEPVYIQCRVAQDERRDAYRRG